MPTAKSDSIRSEAGGRRRYGRGPRLRRRSFRLRAVHRRHRPPSGRRGALTVGWGSLFSSRVGALLRRRHSQVSNRGRKTDASGLSTGLARGDGSLGAQFRTASLTLDSCEVGVSRVKGSVTCVTGIMPTRPRVASATRRRGGVGSVRKRDRATRRSARRGRGSWSAQGRRLSACWKGVCRRRCRQQSHVTASRNPHTQSMKAPRGGIGSPRGVAIRAEMRRARGMADASRKCSWWAGKGRSLLRSRVGAHGLSRSLVAHAGSMRVR